jgi:transcriptional regulator with XRE-family HTH domain
MKDIMAIIKGKLKEARESADLSQDEVAKKLGLSQGAYSDFERGKTRLDVNYLVQLSTILSKPVTWFLGIDDENGRHLAPDEVELLDAYRSLPYEVKPYALGIVQDMAQRAKDNKE